MSFPLLSTKFYFPPTRLNFVPRPRLIERLNAGLRGTLTLISAPAGYGKTTLLSEWRIGIGCDFPVAWLSLDASDNDPNRFLQNLTASLAMLKTGLLNSTTQLLTTPQPPPSEVLITSLINELNLFPQNFVLILDDYHVIINRVIHEAIGFFLDRQPAQMHLVILTRSDPPLPLARLRVRNQLMEIRAVDLRFAPHEAAMFLNQVMGLELSTNDIASMETRTEGWIAGLQMAALSMRGSPDPSSFIQAFSGSNRFILDYLAEEVISGQPESVQQFLLQSSILERLSGSLCDAVTGQNDGRAILEQIEKANLFLMPLDDARSWYRYHHLFANLLRARLDQFYPGQAPRLHVRAAAWLENNGMTVEAINHALAGGDHDHAGRMVEENTTRLLAQGELSALMGWISELPVELQQARPWLCIHQAYALAFAGRLAEVPPLLTRAMAAPGLASMTGKPGTSLAPSTDTNALAGAVTAIQAMCAVMMGQDAEAIVLARQARDLLPDQNLWDRAAAAWALGYALRSLGRLAEARAAFEEQIQLGRAMGNIWTLVTALTDLAQVFRTQGQLQQARALIEEALSEASQEGARSLGYIARMETSLASVLYEQNDLQAAQQLLAEAIAHIRQWPNPNHAAFTYVLQTKVQLALGDLEHACISIDEADRVRKSTVLTRWNQRMVEVELVRVWIALLTAGVRLAPGYPLAKHASALVEDWQNMLADIDSMDEGADMAALALARVALFAGRNLEALYLAQRVYKSALSAGRIGGAIESLIITAIALHRSDGVSSGKAVPSIVALEKALNLAEPGGYLRVFLDEGQPVQLLLAQWLAQAGTNPLQPYAASLLSHFDVEKHVVTAAPEKVSPNDALVEPLSQRELEVLRLIALGITNQEIARQLIIAPGTVKAHTASIYRKIEVATRTEAVARARQLGILS